MHRFIDEIQGERHNKYLAQIVNRRCSVNDAIICHSCGLVEDGTGLGMKGILTLGSGGIVGNTVRGVLAGSGDERTEEGL